MEDGGYAAHGLLDRLEVRQLSANDFQAAITLREGEVGAMAGGKIVEHTHAMPLGEEALHDVGPDESGAARDEIGGWFCHDERLIMVVAARTCQLD